MSFDMFPDAAVKYLLEHIDQDMNHEHPKLTEPEVRKHLCDFHGWPRLKTLGPHLTYFQALVAHMKEHND